MEKEVFSVKENKIRLNFYYEGSFIKTADHKQEYKTWIKDALKALDWFIDLDKEIYINLSLVSDQEIKEINAETRAKDKITDVLSFPMEENIRKGVFDDFLPELDAGDILICKSVCEKQAQEFDISYFEEFVHLFIHGFLHLWGYDHEINEEEEKIMFDLEETLVKKISELRTAS